MRSHTSTPTRRWTTMLGATALVAALGAPAAVASDCDLEVSHAPTGSQGDTAAVAITSQTLAAGVDGWERVGWQAAADTTVTAVTLVREEGTEQRTDGDLSEGMAEHVRELRFCATTGDAEASATDRAEVVQVTAAAEEPDAASAQEPADAPGGAEEPEPTDTDTTDADPPDDAPATEPESTTEADDTGEADEAAALAHPGDEHESAGPQPVMWGDDTGTADAEVEQATLAAAVQEPTAPLVGGLVGALIGLVVFAGAQRRRTQEERP